MIRYILIRFAIGVILGFASFLFFDAMKPIVNDEPAEPGASEPPCKCGPSCGCDDYLRKR